MDELRFFRAQRAAWEDQWPKRWLPWVLSVLNARNRERLTLLCTELRQLGHQVDEACFDITNDEAALEALAGMREEHGRLDMIVNDASEGRPGTIESWTVEGFERAYRVNVTAAFASCSCRARPRRIGEVDGGSSVINIARCTGVSALMRRSMELAARIIRPTTAPRGSHD